MPLRNRPSQPCQLLYCLSYHATRVPAYTAQLVARLVARAAQTQPLLVAGLVAWSLVALVHLVGVASTGWTPLRVVAVVLAVVFVVAALVGLVASRSGGRR